MTKEDKEKQLKAAQEAAAEANLGNAHSSKNNRLLNQTLNRVLIQEDGIKAREIVDALVTKAAEGDMAAIREVFDRFEGKAVARTELTGADGSALQILVGLDFVKPDRTVS
jgi:ribosomal protein L17